MISCSWHSRSEHCADDWNIVNIFLLICIVYLLLCCVENKEILNPESWILSGKTCYRQISWSIGPRDWLLQCSYCSAIGQAYWQHCCQGSRQVKVIGPALTRIWRIWGFTRSYNKTSVRLVNRGPTSYISQVREEKNEWRNVRTCNVYCVIIKTRDSE